MRRSCSTRVRGAAPESVSGQDRLGHRGAGAAGEPATDHIATLLDMAADPARVPGELSIRNLGGFGAQGEGKYMMNKYLRERGDANIRSNADLISKATFYQDPNFPDRKQMRENTERQVALDTAVRLQGRFAVQSIVLQCMQEQRLDALVAPTASSLRRS